MASNSDHIIQLTFNFTHDLGLRSFEYDVNTTGLPNDSELLKKISFTLLKALHMNNDDVQLQDMLFELGITETTK